MRFKFITLNIWKGGEMWEPMLQFLRTEQPDILVVQEAYNGTGRRWPPRLKSVELLKQALELPRASFAATRREHHDMGRVENGNAVFSRWPIMAEHNRFFDVPYEPNYVEQIGAYEHIPRAMQLVTVQLPETRLHIGNVHGIWGKDGADTPRRLNMAEVIVEELAGKAPLLLAGDFNMQEGTESIGKIEAMAPSVFKGQFTSTFNMRRKENPGYATAIVDMIFATPEVRIVSREMPDVDISDHMPLVVEAEVP